MAARQFEKFQSPGKGNGLRATTLVRPGTLLYVAEPFAYTACKSGGRQVCDFCLSLTHRLLRCSRCKFVKYCGVQCQKEAWPDHKRECNCLKSIQPKEPTESVQLVGRAIFKLLKKSPCPSEVLYSLSELHSTIGELSGEMLEGLSQLAMMLQLYLKEEIPDASHLPAGLNVVEFYSKVACNTFSISNAEMHDVGAGLYPSMSLLNHDCDPNCVIIFEGKRLFLRAVREIQKGKEMTISYVNTMMPSGARQSELMRQYVFECSCYRCETKDKDEIMVAGDKHAATETKIAKNKALQLQIEGKWEQSLELCRATLESNVGHLSDGNIYQLEILDCAMDACIYGALWEEALLYGSRTLEPYRLYCQAICPVRAIQMMKVGKLQYLHDKLPEALRTMKEAIDIMNLTHGRDHRLTEEMRDMLKNCEASSIAARLDIQKLK